MYGTRKADHPFAWHSELKLLMAGVDVQQLPLCGMFHDS
jgi:hypothetical protein